MKIYIKLEHYTDIEHRTQKYTETRKKQFYIWLSNLDNIYFTLTKNYPHKCLNFL